MKVFRSLEEVPSGFGPSAVTIGKFDGLHRGHRAVIDELVGVARRRGLTSVVVTFDRHPLAHLDPAARPAPLVSNAQRLDLIAEAGVEATLLLPFDATLAAMSPEEFAARVLRDVCGAQFVMVGEDFRFGAKGAGSIDTLRSLAPALGFEVDVVADVRPEGDRKVSSTWIRELLAEGDVEGATELLGRAPSVRGVVVHGAARGRELGYPTANLSPDCEGLIPDDGVYAGTLTDGDRVYPAAISVGSNPTFEGVPPKQVEAYVLDRELDLYDHLVEVAFLHRVRGQVRFTGVEPLIAQMDDDVRRIREMLS
ncbi:riboflavin biosynthesis protein [Cnuibacter physcomitrellae]|uniref:Riboflavin biosynthesis protein n=1 Tax=Cnuibacter physcomitrellae TaxID=1619308 RepID=A0A1X9LR08_9MICO|nr:bifunctional riboflavin kinase/FAD synthetase [Cnuibacter physcomitrellae]ARJ05569.1 riboflavin biosynthesis protein RibF [Cnuibacter physcomitrellae]GGI35980.1 riboflavin biosynthesis protein [Cnuibacter physcomitrellae]